MRQKRPMHFHGLRPVLRGLAHGLARFVASTHMRVLIIGCGYVGLPLGEALVRAGHEVFGVRMVELFRFDLERYCVVESWRLL